MKIVVIHGTNHKGSTYNVSKILTDKIEGVVKEFFLPRDFGEFCLGCTQCFMKDEKLCPHHEKRDIITKELIEADVIVLESPVYVYHVTGAMKAFLDHYGYMWMPHRPHPSMFKKQAVVISTAAGAGMKSTNKDMADSLFFLGVAKTYKLGFAVRATSFKGVSDKIKAKIEKKTTKVAKLIKKRNGKVKVGFKTKAFFSIMRMIEKNGFNPVDVAYWKENGWLDKNRPWKNK